MTCFSDFSTAAQIRLIPSQERKKKAAQAISQSRPSSSSSSSSSSRPGPSSSKRPRQRSPSPVGHRGGGNRPGYAEKELINGRKSVDVASVLHLKVSLCGRLLQCLT
jgi:hypothetical protein